ncbi:MAG: GNAT family N-acetyltransferase [Aliifodinibius sp.]|nr:GNAT family N-acetyltransferase [Fodinibius sp.]
MRVDYPRELDDFESLLAERDLILVAHRDGEAIGYISVVLSTSKSIGIISDIAVLRRFRRQGVGSAMILAVQATLSEKGIHQVQLEMQSKNHPAIELANKLGFEFSGFSDRYYYNQDIALFFRRRL